VPFQIIPIQLNLPLVNSTQSVVTSTSEIGPLLNSSVSEKGMNTYAMYLFRTQALKGRRALMFSLGILLFYYLFGTFGAPNMLENS